MLPKYFSYYAQCLRECDYPVCAFAAFVFLKGSQSLSLNAPAKLEYDLFVGDSFIHKALKRKIWPIGTMGMFNREYLINNNGFPDITKQPEMLGLYGEYILLIQAGLQDKVPFIHQPLTAFRIHGDSWSEKNSEVDLIQAANINFINKATQLLQQPALHNDFRCNIQSIMEVALYSLSTALYRCHTSPLKIVTTLYRTAYYQTAQPVLQPAMRRAFWFAFMKTIKTLCGKYLKSH